MATNPETELTHAIAVLLILRVLQIVGVVLGLVGLFSGQWPKAVLAGVFVVAIGGQIPRPNGKE